MIRLTPSAAGGTVKRMGVTRRMPAKGPILIAASLLMVTACVREELDTGPERPDFRSILMRGGTPGNTLEGFEAASVQGVRYAEADFVLTKDGRLVAGHEDELGGNCGSARSRTLSQLERCPLPDGHHVATLDAFLALPFDEVFIDLKVRGDEGTTLRRAVQAALIAIEATGREATAVLLIYGLSAEIADEIHQAGVRAGMKGCPTTPDSVKQLIGLAAEHDFELMCSEAKWLTPELIRFADDRGVAMMPWDLDANAGHLRDLIEAGVYGLIVRDVDAIEALASEA